MKKQKYMSSKSANSHWYPTKIQVLIHTKIKAEKNLTDCMFICILEALLVEKIMVNYVHIAKIFALIKYYKLRIWSLKTLKV